MAKLTKRVVDAAENRAGEYFLWDEDLPGFGLRSCPAVASDTSFSTAPADDRAASPLDPTPCSPASRREAGRSPLLPRPRMAKTRCRGVMLTGGLSLSRSSPSGSRKHKISS